MVMGSKCLRDAAAASVAVKKARLEAKAWVSEVEKHLRMAGPKKGSASAAVGNATEINHWLERISLQLEQMTEMLCKLIS
ncbi:uncharacterized protein BDCG_16436 [Blastomyces dermatitidis ER-3]|uniref:Uncharacterized protein n=1 Tax=Ajellomyces dermatitidis (strain ER-3 / ATCC MYA-2586) TaxID=559297 RepID=A0ABX2VS51_AJEDR|nr:uncharacterized protein BDCG_16436 [Blastomyces dermatitidis ER-3]OAT00050.1 hypothetical protein BDCG_16436 [Blastomyces dermatitidis ER-3]